MRAYLIGVSSMNGRYWSDHGAHTVKATKRSVAVCRAVKLVDDILPRDAKGNQVIVKLTRID